MPCDTAVNNGPIMVAKHERYKLVNGFGVIVQVLNRDKLQRAGEDNLFVRLLYAKDKAQNPKNQDEQEKLGMPSDPTLPPSDSSSTTQFSCLPAALRSQR